MKIRFGEDARAEPVDRHWDDEGVIPKDLGPDTAYLFDRMTRETLEAVDAVKAERVLDVGCGRGLDLASLGASGASLYGSDGSAVMVRKAACTLEARGLPPLLALASAENLPFASSVFHKVYCKGAIDHFYDPARALEEMARVLQPGGSLVVSVANFESLSCRMGRLYNRAHRQLKGRELPSPHFWEIPQDHIYRFHRTLLRHWIPKGIRIERELGISLLWGFPRWGGALRALPAGLARALLRGLDGLARRAPGLADVMVIRGGKGERIFQDERATENRTLMSDIATNGVGTMKTYSRMQGLLLCLGTVLAAVLFLVGIVTKSYWALAIPVAVGFLWLLGLGFWIGWTLLTIRVEPPKE